MFGVSKSFSKCFTVAEHQGVELLSFPYLQELRIPWLSGAQYEFSGMTHNQRSSIIPATPDSLLSTSKAFAHQPLGQVHHWWPSGWRWPHRPQAPWLRRERGCWSFFLVIVARICFFLLGVIQLSVTIPIYSIIYPFIILYYILNPWVDSRENTSEFVLLPSYYRPNCQSQVPPPDHTRPPVFQTCRLAKCAHIHLDWIHVDSMQTSP
jgi:hypothetical protein